MLSLRLANGLGIILVRGRLGDGRLGPLHPGFFGDQLLFQIAHGFRVVGDLLAIVAADRFLQLAQPFAHPIQHALAAFEPSEFPVHVPLVPREEHPGVDLRGAVQGRNAGPGRSVRQRAPIQGRERHQREPRGPGDVLRSEDVQRHRVAEPRARGVFRAGQKAGFGRMVAADVRMRDAREDRELVAQIAQHSQIFTGFVIATRLRREERRSIQPKAGADRDDPLRRSLLVGPSESFQPRQGQHSRTGPQHLPAGELCVVQVHSRSSLVPEKRL